MLDRYRPAHVQKREWPALGIRRWTAGDLEADRLVEVDRALVCGVDVDGERIARCEPLRVLHETAAHAAAMMSGIDEQCFDRVLDDAEKARDAIAGLDDPPLKRIAP